MKITLFLLSLLINLIVTNQVWARFATYQEASAEIDIYNVSINVDKEGNYEILQEVQLKILNESGREQLANQSFVYNSGNESIEVIEARTIQGGTLYKVGRDMIMDKTLAGSESGFDDMNRIQIAFPNVTVGSSIYYRVKINRREPIFNGFYEAFFSPGGSDFYVKSYNLNLKSKLKLNYDVNDPHKKMDVNFTEKNGTYILTAKLKSFLFEKIVFEEGFLTTNQRTFIEVSALDSYDQYVVNIAPQYERVITAPLPQILEDIAAGASKIEKQNDQINYITSELAQQIRYMGDWRTVKGKFFPRSFSEVVASGYGDCKDFASMTTAILRKLGYRAFPSLIDREEGALFEKSKIIETLYFNHVIVQVTGKDGKILWIDPTNFVSYAGGIFPDIAHRPALVLNLSAPLLSSTPEINYNSAVYNNEKAIALNSEGDGTNSGSFSIIGEAAIPYTGAGLIFSQKELDEKLTYLLSGEVSPQDVAIKVPDLTSRIVKNINIEYSYSMPNAAFQTNLGMAYDMSNSWPSTYLGLPQDQVGTIYVGFPKTVIRKIKFTNIAVKSPESLNANIKTKWFNAERNCLKEAQDVVCSEKIATTKSFITPEDIKSQDFTAAKKLLRRYFVSSALIYAR